MKEKVGKKLRTNDSDECNIISICDPYNNISFVNIINNSDAYHNKVLIQKTKFKELNIHLTN
jgi:hypothetical protein